MLLSGLGTGVYADSGATAAVPAFTVTLNGQVVDNSYRQYPLLVYKDITYFPMTYYDCRFLGLETSWKGSNEGLYITATGVSGAYDAYKGSANNKSSYRVSIPTFPITVNGTKVDNSKEEYPLLIFRDVTYFPMTWKWGVDNFNWAYSFDPESGLKISSNSPHVTQSTVLPNIETKDITGNNTLTDAACYANGRVCWRTADGKIVQATLSNLSTLSSAKTLYTLPTWTYSASDGKVSSNLVNMDGKIQLRFHQGGAVMGSDYKFDINADNTLTMLQDGYWETVQLGDRLFAYWVGPTPGPGMLASASISDSSANGSVSDDKQAAVKVIDKTDFVNSGTDYFIGSGDYWYAGLSKAEPKLALIGERLYLNAAKSYKMEDGTLAKKDFYLSYVDLKTNEVTVAASVPYEDDDYLTAVPAGDCIYYASGAKCYVYDTKTGTDKLLGTMSGTERIYYLGVAGDSVYAADLQGELHKLGETQAVNKGATVDGMKQVGENDEYLVCSFAETASSQYRLMVFDASGACVFKTADKTGINTVSMENGRLYYYNCNFKTICSVPL